jgi:hypothetical protein
MGAHTPYILDIDNKPIFGGTAIDAVIDWSVNPTASVVQGNSEGAPVIQGVYVDNQNATISINVADIKKAMSNFNIGDKETLVLYAVVREPGAGGGTTTLTITFANAVVTDINSTAPHAGESSGSITFQPYDNGDGVLYTVA